MVRYGAARSCDISGDFNERIDNGNRSYQFMWRFLLSSIETPIIITVCVCATQLGAIDYAVCSLEIRDRMVEI